MIRFGPSGNSESFYDQGYSSSVEMPEWLAKMGLNAYEYSCSKGVKIGEATAKQLGAEAAKYGIFLSIHAPYYINMASEEPEKREKSKAYILETLKAAQWMGAKRVVVHTGSCSKVSREWAVKSAMEVFHQVLADAEAMGFGEITLCPEVLGKLNQLGSLEEILTMCRAEERLIPTIDFGHLHARGMGCLNTKEDFRRVLDSIENGIGKERFRVIHSHFSRLEFTKGGEKKHWTLADTQFGPDFEPLAELLAEKGMEPVIISESRGTMAEDALQLKKIYEKAVLGVK